MASGINTTFRQVGIAAGIAVLGAIFSSGIRTRLAPHLAGTPVAGHSAALAHAVAGGGAQSVLAAVPASLRGRATEGVHAAFAGAMNEILLVAAVVALIGAALGLILVRKEDFVMVAAHARAEVARAGGR
jgi:hypothetical protein